MRQETKNTLGQQKMLHNGQRIRAVLHYQHSFDSLYYPHAYDDFKERCAIIGKDEAKRVHIHRFKSIYIRGNFHAR